MGESVNGRICVVHETTMETKRMIIERRAYVGRTFKPSRCRCIVIKSKQIRGDIKLVERENNQSSFPREAVNKENSPRHTSEFGYDRACFLLLFS
jgi:hypothetical protein